MVVGVAAISLVVVFVFESGIYEQYKNKQEYEIQTAKLGAVQVRGIVNYSKPSVAGKNLVIYNLTQAYETPPASIKSQIAMDELGKKYEVIQRIIVEDTISRNKAGFNPAQGISLENMPVKSIAVNPQWQALEIGIVLDYLDEQYISHYFDAIRNRMGDKINVVLVPYGAGRALEQQQEQLGWKNCSTISSVDKPALVASYAQKLKDTYGSRAKIIDGKNNMINTLCSKRHQYSTGEEIEIMSTLHNMKEQPLSIMHGGNLFSILILDENGDRVNSGGDIDAGILRTILPKEVYSWSSNQDPHRYYQVDKPGTYYVISLTDFRFQDTKEPLWHVFSKPIKITVTS